MFHLLSSPSVLNQRPSSLSLPPSLPSSFFVLPSSSGFLFLLSSSRSLSLFHRPFSVVTGIKALSRLHGCRAILYALMSTHVVACMPAWPSGTREFYPTCLVADRTSKPVRNISGWKRGFRPPKEISWYEFIDLRYIAPVYYSRSRIQAFLYTATLNFYFFHGVSFLKQLYLVRSLLSSSTGKFIRPRPY